MPLPHLPLAVALLPDIARWLATDSSGLLGSRVSEAVTQATGAAGAQAAHAAVAADPALAAGLRMRLAEILLAHLPESGGGAPGDGAKPASAHLELPPLQPLPWGPALISSLVILAFLVVMVLLVSFNHTFPPETAALVNITVGTLGAAFASVVNFWIGSSQSAHEKDRLAGVLQRAQTVQAGEQVQSALSTLRDMAATPSNVASLPRTASAPDSPEERFDRCLAVVLQQEGGFVNDPRDPGGATNMGITRDVLSAFRDRAVTVDEVRDLSRAEAREIYRARYWTPMRCAELPPGVDLGVFDFGVNAGPSRAVKLLQKAVGVMADGSVGPITLAAARALEAERLIASFSEARLAYYRSLDGFARFGRGWANRTEAVRMAALRMAGTPSRAAA
ncbi:putative membrane associated protein [Roseomonas mucosa]|uniref:Predicted lysozyme (DUF847) n=3 Tax=Roseomonas mucosa TaxID=207340 RepID=A0A379MWA7_9PROT|nr:MULTISPECIES: glycosyl hydrolase 108 family protein [Roseomonas]MBS5903670.1 glycoside hydrolase family 108 protein [Acetobacteraceae bacterium]MDT8288504.1 glycosyl hydrolase 108 family protein [Roseomonas mucosa]MDT8293655.1 glycosyl hydrolase 108 family protein [Roseomonas mucosa]MDT8314177.1 glycosyl hydrolase 108 family protein [Roseomonas mucosa]MDT8349682.1 glycosyl hydrolase 108 family protein [Roseomonas mucosa]